MRLRISRTGFALVAVLIVGFGGVVYLTKLSTSSSAPGSSGSDTPLVLAEKVSASDDALLKHSLDTKVLRTFSVQQELSVELSPSQGQSTSSRIHTRGQFDEQLVAVSGSSLTYRFRFHDFVFESTDAKGNAATSPADAAGIVQAIQSTTLLLKTDRRRSELSWSVSKSTPIEAFNLLRSLVLAGSVFLPQQKEPKEWTGVDEDSTGIFTHSYRLMSYVDGKAVLEKEPRMVRMDTEALSSQSSSQSVVVLPSSISKIEFDGKNGHLLKADQRWALRAQAAGLMATTQLQTQITFVKQFRIADTNVTDSGANGTDALKPEDFSNEHEVQAAQSLSLKKKVASQKVAGETWSSLRERFRSSEFHKDGAARAQFFEQLSALLYLQPELCTEVANEIAQLDKNDPDYKSKLSLLSGVFSSQETPEAEAAMAALADKLKDDAPALMQVIPALASHHNPSERTRDALLNAYNSATDVGVKSTTTLALGTFATRAKNSRPDLTRETVERLKQDFDNSSSIEQKVTLSGALGNAAARETLESVKSLYAGTQDSSLKRSALYDLRFVDDPDVDDFLEKVIFDSATDPDLVVQSLRVMRVRPPLKRHLDSSVSLFRNKKLRPTVRSEALYTIAYLTPVAPDEVRTVLGEALKDANSQLAKQAEQLLAKQNQPM